MFEPSNGMAIRIIMKMAMVIMICTTVMMMMMLLVISIFRHVKTKV